MANDGGGSRAAPNHGLAVGASRKDISWSKVGVYVLLFAGVIIAIGPFLWMISASFMTLSEVNLTRLLPENLLWEN